MRQVALEEVSEKLAVYLDRLKTGGPIVITRDGQPVAVLMALDEAGLDALRRGQSGPMAEERVEEDTWAGEQEAIGEGHAEEEAETGNTEEESMQMPAQPHPHDEPTGVREETE
ncbi:MAG: type II toxin-antitoxin system Phd/YefM family antitoxin [Anaerolineae bacterium]|nr:type II toxin-antitoxin system Phd/YefM family antitoxin [Anaerolineae bacterium]